MAILGIGMDIIRITRISESLEKYGERFTRRIYHPVEIEFSRTRSKDAEFLAACFAVKEAALKAFGDFPGKGISWADMYVTHEPTGKPVLNFAGKAKKLADEKGVKQAWITITHDGDLAVAQVILEG